MIHLPRPQTIDAVFRRARRAASRPRRGRVPSRRRRPNGLHLRPLGRLRAVGRSVVAAARNPRRPGAAAVRPRSRFSAGLFRLLVRRRDRRAAAAAAQSPVVAAGGRGGRQRAGFGRVNRPRRAGSIRRRRAAAPAVGRRALGADRRTAGGVCRRLERPGVARAGLGFFAIHIRLHRRPQRRGDQPRKRAAQFRLHQPPLRPRRTDSHDVVAAVPPRHGIDWRTAAPAVDRRDVATPAAGDDGPPTGAVATSDLHISRHHQRRAEFRLRTVPGTSHRRAVRRIGSQQLASRFQRRRTGASRNVGPLRRAV